MSLWLSIVLIAVCALCWDVGVVLQKRAVDSLSGARLGTWSSFKAMLTSARWMAGLVMTAIGWGLFAWALESTPVSLARAIQGSGLVILALFSRFFLSHRLHTKEWIAVAVVTLGIVALGLSEPVDHPTTTVLIPSSLAVGVTGSLALCGAMIFNASRFQHIVGLVSIYSASAGLLLGLGDVLTKALLVSLETDQRILALAFLGALLSAVYIGGFLLLSKSYQYGRALVATAVSDTAARLVTIVVGVLALGESFPKDAYHGSLRVLGLGVVLVGTAVLTRFSGEEWSAPSV